MGSLIGWTTYVVGIIIIMTFAVHQYQEDGDEERIAFGVFCGIFWPLILVFCVLVGAAAVPFYFLPKGLLALPGAIRGIRKWHQDRNRKRGKNLVLKKPAEPSKGDWTSGESVSAVEPGRWMQTSD